MESTATRRFIHVPAVMAVFSLAAALAGAATVPEPTPLFLGPDADSPVVGTLPAGSSYTALSAAELATAGIPETVPGWVGIRHSGPFFGFADNESVAKDLVLHPASQVHALPDADSPVIHTVGEEETVDVIAPADGWVKVVFRDDRVVFIRTQVAAAAATPEPANPSQTTTFALERSAAPSRIVAPDPDEAGPQLIRGYLLEARPTWRSAHNYGHQLVGEDNQMLALLDSSALLQAEPIETFKNRLVEVYGAIVPAPNVKAIVFRAETLSLAGPPAP